MTTHDGGLIARGPKWPPTIGDFRETIGLHRLLLARSWLLLAGRNPDCARPPSSDEIGTLDCNGSGKVAP